MENYNIKINYRFKSYLGPLESLRYINEYKVKIYSIDEGVTPTKKELIGKARLSLILLSLVMNDEMDFYEVFDHSQFLFEIGEAIFDFDKEEFKESLLEEMESSSANLLVIDRLELLPQWRHKGIGQKIIKDIILRFSGCCDLVILKAFPLQREVTNNDTNISKWRKKMQMDKLPEDEEFSFFKVYSYYQKIGFKRYEDSGYFYLNPALINEKFDAIDIED